MTASGVVAAVTQSGYLSGLTKSSAAPLVGIASLALGVAEATTATDPWSALVGPFNIAAGGTVLVLYLFGKSLLGLAQRWLDSQGEKLIALPTAEELKHDKASLFEQLEKFATASHAERREMASFRELIAATLADHGARISGLERFRTTEHE